MRHNGFTIFFGIFLILIGIDALFSNMGVPNLVGFAFRLWPLFLVYWGAKKLGKGQGVSGGLLIVFGALFLLSNYDILKYSVFSLFWPLLIVFVGLSVVISAFTPKKQPEVGSSTGTTQTTSSEGRLDDVTILSGSNKKITTDNFQGGSTLTFLGGSELDLTQCKVGKSGATLEVVAVLGGATIKVAPTTNIRLDVVPVLGACEDHRKNTQANAEEGILTIKAVAVMGGVELKS
jgi:predicted membrane protein